MSIINLVNVSGGKDSTALALLAIEREAPNLQFVFGDTGHESQITYQYLDYLDEVIFERTGQRIQRVRADFSAQIERKRGIVADKWRRDGVPEAAVLRALDALVPPGNPFLDLTIWKGRFPSTKTRFCTQELKIYPVLRQVVEPLLAEHDAVIQWMGVRRDESKARANLPQRDVEFGTWGPEPKGNLIYRPILDWTAEEVFAFHRRHGVKWNPLYELGMKRVGCFPCIHSRKKEIGAIVQRFPEAVDRLEAWEIRASKATKLGSTTFFPSKTVPGTDPLRASARAVAAWSQTAWGGKQIDLTYLAPPSTCSSVYGLCEPHPEEE